MTTPILDTSMAKRMVKAAAIQGASIIGQPGGWAVMLKLGSQESLLGVQRSAKPRMWRSLDTCMEYLKNELHIARVDGIDATHHTRAQVTGVSRPDSSKRMREAFEASAYNKMFEAKVHASLEGLKDGSNLRINQEEWSKTRAEKLKTRVRIAAATE